jgi:rhodanese-related sulfurtransferase
MENMPQSVRNQPQARVRNQPQAICSALQQFVKVMPWLLTALTALLLSSCAAKAGYKDINVQELQTAAEANRILLDVREPSEYAEGHLAGSTLLPLAQVATQAGQLDKNAPVYVICRSGNRSVTASQTLVKLGFKDVRNVKGGILAWQSAGYPVVR